MTDTPNLGLPLIAAAQAQKHVTHNEALLVLDALLHCAVKDKDLNAPPAALAEGDRYIVAAAPTGAWAGKAGMIAAWQDGIWRFYAPKAGMIAFAVDERQIYHFDGSAWAPGTAGISSLQNLAMLGIGTTADVTNPFNAKLNKALWSARARGEGGDGNLRYTLNKETSADTLSLLFQSAFSGRAEFGLTGDDDFRIKVSADGALWREALRIDRATGAVSFPSGGGGSGGGAGHGQCILAKSGANLLLSPRNGNKLVVSGRICVVPSAGLSLAAAGLTVGTTYFIYAADADGDGVIDTLEASTTAYAADAATGVAIKSGDPTRTLVGLARPTAGPAWADTAKQRFVRSWFHRTSPVMGAALAADQTVTAVGAANIAEVSTEFRIEFLLWGDETCVLTGAVTVTNSMSGVSTFTAIGVDGAARDGSGNGFTPVTAGNYNAVPLSALIDKGSEGYHYATVLGYVGAASVGTWKFFNAAVASSLKGAIR